MYGRALLVATLGAAATQLPSSSPEGLAHELLIVDANLLTSYRLTLDEADVTQRSDVGEFDVPRAKDGGLDLAVMGMLIPARHRESGDAREVAEARIREMLEIVESAPDLVLVGSVEAARAAHRDGRVGVMLAIENGAPLGSDTDSVAHFYERGVRLITLVHSRPNQLGDSSYAQHRPWRGLSELGGRVVREMNRQGLIIDVAHIADDAFDQVVELSEAPVIASHTSCREFTPGWERNLDDDRIRRLAAKGGVIHITFGGSFLSTELMSREQPVWDHVEGQGLSINSIEGRRQAQEFRREHGIRYAEVSDIADHIDHVVELVGIDHVGIGSGFDGSGDSMPYGLKDVSGYPALIEELLSREYSREAIEKILSGNFLRVWSEVERLREL